MTISPACQVADQAPPGRQTKPAPLGAPYLGGQAQGIVALFRDEHRFDQVAVFQGEQEFPAAVRRRLHLLHLEVR